VEARVDRLPSPESLGAASSQSNAILAPRWSRWNGTIGDFCSDDVLAQRTSDQHIDPAITCP